MRLHVQLIAETPDSTLSVLTIAGEFVCFVLEDGYREKKIAGETRIAPGVYRVEQRKEGHFFEQYRAQFRHGYALELKGVPNFQYILLHIGNTVHDTRGCLLVGLGVGFNGNFAVNQSTAAYLQLYEMVKLAFDKGEVVEVEVSRERWMRGA